MSIFDGKCIILSYVYVFVFFATEIKRMQTILQLLAQHESARHSAKPIRSEFNIS